MHMIRAGAALTDARGVIMILDVSWSFGNTMELWQHHAALHLSPRMASGISLPTPGVLRLAAAGVDMSLPTSGNQVSSIWRPLAPGCP